MRRNHRIDAIKYYGIIGMCLLHGSFIIENSNNELLYFIATSGGAPAFVLFLSAFYFSMKFEFESINSKMLSKIKTVFVPFFVWNLFLIFFYKILNVLEKTTGIILTHETYFPSGFKEIIKFTIQGWRNPPLWYLWVLMQFFFISPVLISFVRQYKKVLLSVFFSCGL